MCWSEAEQVSKKKISRLRIGARRYVNQLTGHPKLNAKLVLQEISENIILNRFHRITANNGIIIPSGKLIHLFGFMS